MCSANILQVIVTRSFFCSLEYHKFSFVKKNSNDRLFLMYRSVLAAVVVAVGGGWVGGGVGAGSVATSAARGPSLVTKVKTYFCYLVFFQHP